MDRAKIMQRAWELFRSTYNYPSVPFASIGKPCFAWAMRAAWQEAREAAKFAAIPANTKAAMIANLQRELAATDYMANYRQAQSRRQSIKASLQMLAA